MNKILTLGLKVLAHHCIIQGFLKTREGQASFAARHRVAGDGGDTEAQQE